MTRTKPKSKLYLITGGSSGIGAATAKQLLADGHQVVIVSRQTDKSDLLADPNCHGYDVDLQSVAAIQNFAAQLRQDFPHQPIAGLINAAGVGYSTQIPEVDEATWDAFFDTNVKGLFFMTQALLDLIDKETGVIVNLSSIAGLKTFADWSIYCATKWAVQGLTGSIRKELQAQGSKIRVMNVQPGAVDTPLYDFLKPEEKQGFMSPEAIADTIIHLLNLPPDVSIEDVFINNAVGDL